MANIVRRSQQRREISPMGSEWLDPFRTFRNLLGMDPFAALEPFATAPSTLMPNVEVKDTGDAMVFKVDLPGVEETDLDLSIAGNQLTISGKREEEERQEDDRYYAYERVYGTFSRTFTLPETADPDNVKAELKNGVLSLVVPKKANAQSRRIQIGKGQGKVVEQPSVQQQQGSQKKAA